VSDGRAAEPGGITAGRFVKVGRRAWNAWASCRALRLRWPAS
jgi:hypothetical protein